MKKNHNPLYLLLDLITHVFVGTVMFCIIAIPAVGLSLLLKWLAAVPVSTYTLQILTFLEHAIVTIDVATVLVYILSSIYREIKATNDD
jgi:hypothetical protein